MTVSLAIHTMHVYFIFLTRVTVIETLMQCLYMVYMSIYTYMYVYLHVSGIVQCAAYYIGYIMRFGLKFVHFIRVFLQSTCLMCCKMY